MKEKSPPPRSIRPALRAAILFGATAFVPTGARPTPDCPEYRFERTTAAFLRRLDAPHREFLEMLNRMDSASLAASERIVVPVEWPADPLECAPLPREWSRAAARPKMFVVHLPHQVFGAYEEGRLVRWGPVSSGARELPTPAGLYHLTWKARCRVSTDNEEWILNWSFNFASIRGLSFHEARLPGHPASHGCVRLRARDAQWLYGWGEQWRLSPDESVVIVPGTAVLVIGAYDFGRPPPWRSPAEWRNAAPMPDDP